MNKKTLFFGMMMGSLLTAITVNAQFRRIPGVVTDSFKIKYPNAQGVTWEDKITNFQASFNLDSGKYIAKYNSKGEWILSEKKIKPEELPAAVKDGLSKSKYYDWETGTMTVRYLPGNQTQYGIAIRKSDIQRRTLWFSDSGRLLKD